MKKLHNPTQEEWFDEWCSELLAQGYLDEVVTHPNVPTFQLFKGYSRPYGKKKNTVMQPTTYTPDRILKWNDKAKGIFFEDIAGANKLWDNSYFNAHYQEEGGFYYSIIEVKGPTGNQSAYGTKFMFTQKWLWQNSGQYVQKVMLAPIKPLKKNLQYLWPTTFTPKRFLHTDKLTKLRTIPSKKGVPNWDVRSLTEFVNAKTPQLSGVLAKQ